MELENEIQIDLLKIMKAIKKRIWLILIYSILAGLVGVLLTISTPSNVFNAASTVYSAAMGSYTESAEGTKAMQVYAGVVKSMKVAERATLLMGDDTITADKVYNAINVAYAEGSPILTIYAVSTDSQEAVKISKAVANAFVVEMNNIIGGNQIQVLDEASHSEISYNARREQMKCRILFALGGFVLAVAYIVITTIVSKRIERVEEASLNGKIAILGAIPLRAK